MGSDFFYNDGLQPVNDDDHDWEYPSSDNIYQDEEPVLVVEEEPGVMVTQYIAQDELGQISFGYAHPGQAATNYRDALGNQFGSWAYITPEGLEITVSYIADTEGFRVFSDALPVAPQVIIEPPTETAEVAAARAEHMAAYIMAKNRLPGTVPVVPEPVVQPVTETPEVVHARQEFMKVFNEAKSRSAKVI